MGLSQAQDALTPPEYSALVTPWAICSLILTEQCNRRPLSHIPRRGWWWDVNPRHGRCSGNLHGVHRGRVDKNKIYLQFRRIYNRLALYLGPTEGDCEFSFEALVNAGLAPGGQSSLICMPHPLTKLFLSNIRSVNLGLCRSGRLRLFC
jgi:hypothetical protein